MKLIPASSQTVGPFFRIGFDYLAEQAPAPDGSGSIEIHGQVLDRDGAPVPDAILEFWSPNVTARTSSAAAQETGFPDGFRRAATNMEGRFSVVMGRPAEVAFDDERIQAPHMLVLVFARGLLRHLISRVYFDGDPGIVTDPVLLEVPVE